jgi:hypothetical protein
MSRHRGSGSTAIYRWRASRGGRRDSRESRKYLDKSLTRLYIEARGELGLKGADVYEDPDGGHRCDLVLFVLV